MAGVEPEDVVREPWCTLGESGGERRLFVEGKPFVSLGIQLNMSTCETPEQIAYLYPHLERMAVNTVFFPIQWYVIEPEEGEFDFSLVDYAIERAEALGHRLSWLWFGTNQGASNRPAPHWVKEDVETFRRVVTAAGKREKKLCPTGETTLRYEKRALEAFLAHCAERDVTKRGIFLQVENEPCLNMTSLERAHGDLIDPYSYRCHCPACNERFAAFKGSEWEYSATVLADYLEALCAEQKRIYPVLSYVNFLLNPQRPGQDIDIYLARCPSIDIIGVDYYGFGPADLAFTMRFFERGRNPPFIAEHSTESVGDAGMNAFRAICEHGAIAFDPWAIDHTFGWRAWRDKCFERPFVDRAGTFSEAALDYAASCRALGFALSQVAANARTPNLLTYTSERGQPRSLEERFRGLVFRAMAGPKGRWALVQTADGDFTFVGYDVHAVFEPIDRGRKLSIESGSWQGDTWVPGGSVPILGPAEHSRLCRLDEPGCLRLRLGPRP
jgi:hypothetical protein